MNTLLTKISRGWPLLTGLLVAVILTTSCSASRNSKKRRYHRKAPCRECPSFSYNTLHETTADFKA
ncbi:MAG: hypothetical protein PHQ65_14310 [Bacteroidales bacterium]|nr:hypothetical protein [Bacteroidales bacterium]MDD3666435.1 hypothetical protein [Bacteroidales bacterium]